MKLTTCDLTEPREDFVVIPRGEKLVPERDEEGKIIRDEDGKVKFKTVNNDAVFKVKAVLDFEKFDAACPSPKPPLRTEPGRDPFPWYDAPEYRKKITEHSTFRTNFIIVESLSATEGLQWETVTDDPKTWGNFEKELLDAGFTDREIQEILAGVFQINGFSDKLMTEARQRFLQSQVTE